MDGLIEHGPLGNENRRRQIGLGALLSLSGDRGTRVRLIDTSSEKQDDALAQAVTITCGQSDASDPNLPIATRMYRLEGILKWGSQGVQQEARFDWANGTVVRPVGGSFQVDCEMLPAFGQTVIGASARAQAIAHAGYGSALKPALLTAYQVDQGGAGVTFPVPKFASRVFWYPNTTGANSNWVNASGVVVANINAAIIAGYGEGLVPNVYGLRLVPTVAGTAFFCVWQLTF